MIDFNVNMNGANTLLTQGTMNLTWQYAAAQQESDIVFEGQRQIKGKFDLGAKIKSIRLMRGEPAMTR